MMASASCLRSCFADWWCWQQQDLAEQQLQLEQRTGATAAAALVQVSAFGGISWGQVARTTVVLTANKHVSAHMQCGACIDM